MEPEPDRIDLAPLDPSRDDVRWRGAIRAVATRAIAARARRRALARRGAIVVAVAAAATVLLWLAAPGRDAPAPTRHPGDAVLELVDRASPELVLGVGDAN